LARLPSVLELPEAAVPMSYTASYPWGALHVSEEAHQAYNLDPLPPLVQEGKILRPDVLDGNVFLPLVEGRKQLDLFIVSPEQMSRYSSDQQTVGTPGLSHRAAHYKSGVGIAIKSYRPFFEPHELKDLSASDQEVQDILLSHYPAVGEDSRDLIDAMIDYIQAQSAERSSNAHIVKDLAGKAEDAVIKELSERRLYDLKRKFVNQTTGAIALDGVALLVMGKFSAGVPLTMGDTLLLSGISAALIGSTAAQHRRDTEALTRRIADSPTTFSATGYRVKRSIEDLFTDRNVMPADTVTE